MNSLRQRALRLTLAPLALAAACASSTPRPAPPPAPAPSATGPQSPPVGQPAPAPAPAPQPEEIVTEPSLVTATLETVSRDALTQEVRALARPRHTGRHQEGLTAVATRVQEGFTAAGFTVTRQPVTHGGATADNLIGERPGARADRVVILCAHYDAVEGTEGADDNASGVASMLAVVRALRGVRTGATVRAIAFAFEEDGLAGSEAYVASLSPEERARIVGVYNLESVGFTTQRPNSQRFPPGAQILFANRPMPTVGNFAGAIALTEGRAPLDALEQARTFVSGLRTELLAVPSAMVPMAADLTRSDHAPFWRAGIPTTIISDSADFRNPHYHRRTDTVSTLDLEFLTQVTRWTTAAVLLQAGARAP